ncbi:MAG: flagellar hook-length control protein FliK [Methylotenera sp.]|nr:flagellar hook-length control protein FliK [Methylotenera sp.]
MMLKQPDNVVQPVARITPTLAVERIASVVQELGDRAAQFVKGQDYFARILSKAGNTTYNVKVETAGVNAADDKNSDIKNVMLQMDIGSSAKAGQTLLLKFINNSPVPTFLLLPNPTNIAGSTTKISSAANLIGQHLKQAESDGVSTRIQATAVVTNTPSNVQLMAQNLNHAIRNSGLFYESHLSNFVQGGQTLTAIRQEPQNQSGSTLAGLMSQQLSVLENQRLSWHGEVWPGQKMDWDVYLEQRDRDASEQWASELSVDEDKPISSELTLHLPHLGRVSAKISLIDGRIRINVFADQEKTLDTLNNQRQTLAEAIVKNGQQLDALTLTKNELRGES